MTTPEISQLLGGMVLTFAALPQITQVYITKDVRGLNLTTFLLLLVGNGLKSIYGIYMAVNGYTVVLIITTGLSFLIIAILVIMVIYYRKHKPNVRKWQ